MTKYTSGVRGTPRGGHGGATRTRGSKSRPQKKFVRAARARRVRRTRRSR